MDLHSARRPPAQMAGLRRLSTREGPVDGGYGSRYAVAGGEGQVAVGHDGRRREWLRGCVRHRSEPAPRRSSSSSTLLLLPAAVARLVALPRGTSSAHARDGSASSKSSCSFHESTSWSSKSSDRLGTGAERRPCWRGRVRPAVRERAAALQASGLVRWCASGRMRGAEERLW